MWRNKEPDLSFDITNAKDGGIKIWIDGTDEWRDLKVTLDGFWPWNDFHRGAVKGARQIYDMLLIADVVNDNKERFYYIGGHSMGGAIARELADMMSYLDYDVRECVTYGAYGTGKRGGAWREVNIRNKYDIVPFIFPWWTLDAEIVNRVAKWPKRFIENHKHYNKTYWRNI